MMTERNSMSTEKSTGNIGFCALLTLLFIGLKLSDKIDWSWWWVISPLWLPAAVILGVLAVTTILVSIFK